MNYSIRSIKESEYPLLDKFLYEAIFIPEGTAAPHEDIIYRPELQVYVAGFGAQRDDRCFVAEREGQVLGAVWARVMEDYGHIEAHTPSLAISVLKAYRGMGIGSDLLKTMLSALQEGGYAQVSLAVQKANYAVRMYQKAGFEIVDENNEEYIMAKDLRKRTQS